MVSKVRVPRNWELWHHWFAWRPVKVRAGTSQMYAWVWWQTIERRCTYSGEQWTSHYRMLR